MKLAYIIVRKDNEDDVLSALTKEKYQITKLASSGGFLKKGNSTLMICTDDDKVNRMLEIIKSECGNRKKINIEVPYLSGASIANYASMPMTVEVGGATIIIVDVVKFEKF